MLQLQRVGRSLVAEQQQLASRVKAARDLLRSMEPFPGTGHVVCCSVTKSCLTFCNPMGCSTPGFPIPHYLLEFIQIHAH